MQPPGWFCLFRRKCVRECAGSIRQSGEGLPAPPRRSERYYGKFYRSIPLPKGAKTDQIEEELTNDVLEVVIPVPDVKPATRQVPIAAK